MRKIAMSVLVVSLLCTGCLYPKDQLAQNKVPPRDAVRLVQAAVDDYQSQTGLLPIKNADMDTPRYEKFHIDLVKLQRQGYLSEIPGAAFEKGGVYYFLLLNEETEPVVKILNVSVLQQMNDLQQLVDRYKRDNGGALPEAGEAYPGFYHVDRDFLKGRSVVSVFSGQPANLIMDKQGALYVDYGIDIRKAVEKDGAEPGETMDLRELLIKHSMYVPVKSTAYYWVDGDPQARLTE